MFVSEHSDPCPGAALRRGINWCSSKSHAHCTVALFSDLLIDVMILVVAGLIEKGLSLHKERSR